MDALLNTAQGTHHTTHGFKKAAASIAQGLLSWAWTKKLLYWLIISAGTMSELVFLVASLWMSVNASVHKFVLLFMSDALSKHISELATAAYVALPELILGLAFVTTLSHLKVWLYDKKHTSSLLWAILYALPTLVFLVLSIVTLSCSVASTDFTLPLPLVIVRAVAGYWFAFISLLYERLGIPQEKERLQDKDVLIADIRYQNGVIIEELKQNNARLNEEMKANTARLNEEITQLKTLLAQSKKAEGELQKTINKSSEDALQGYSEDCKNWLKSGEKSVTYEEITRYTGHSKRKIEGAITKGLLQVSSRNKERVLVSSLALWLQNNPPGQKETEPRLHVVNG